MRTWQSFNVPLFLTLFRLFSVFIVLPPIFLILPWQTSFSCAVFVSSIFFLIGITDFVDGFIARKYKMESPLGQVLDPIADKIFIMAGLFFLAVAGRIETVIAIVLVGREFLVAGLREVAPRFGSVVPVNWLGKGKMASQLLLSVFLIVHPGYYGCRCFPIFFFEYLLLAITLFLSVFSAFFYVRSFLRQAGCSIRKMQ